VDLAADRQGNRAIFGGSIEGEYLQKSVFERDAGDSSSYGCDR
jgi:hypothetical protein